MKMHFDFTAKRVLVTGGTQGIGRGVVEGFLALGAVVAVQGDDAASVAKTISELGGGDRLVAAPGEVYKPEEARRVVSSAVAALGGLDVLVNAADLRQDVRVEAVTPENWDQVLNHSFKAATFCSQQAMDSLKASKGNIVNVASIEGLMGGPDGSAVYASAMGSVVQLTRMTALRLGVDGVRANCLVAGALEGQGGKLGELPAAPPLTIGRLGTVDDMVGPILFLASPYAGFMTGAIVVADGGKTAGA